MRFVDVDKLICRIKTLADYEYDNKRREVFKQCLDCLLNEPTAYDVDKVIEELAENSSNYKKSYKANGKYTHKTIKAISQIKAIGIVRKGGIG